MRILVHDFAGHPFQAQLSRELARRGYQVRHVYCGSVTTGRGDLTCRRSDPPSLEFVDASDGPFDRYNPLRRLFAERRYGQAVARLVCDFRPDVILSANTPLVSQWLLWSEAARCGARRVYWLQDFLGRGARAVLESKARLLGATGGRSLEALETRLLARSDHIVAITEDFLEELARREIQTPTTVIRNWAPLDELGPTTATSSWSEAMGLSGRLVVLYAGTLGLKHDPAHLLHAAQAIQSLGGVVVVLSEGKGREWLEAAKAAHHAANLHLLDYVSYEAFPNVLAAADICTVLLEPTAGTFSVPSKVLSYLAAGRPIAAAIPKENLAARTIEEAGAGVVAEPGDYAAFSASIRALGEDSGRRRVMAENGLKYASKHFDIQAIADRFIEVLV